MTESGSAIEGICPICKEKKELHDSEFDLDPLPVCEGCWDRRRETLPKKERCPICKEKKALLDAMFALHSEPVCKDCLRKKI